MRPLLQLGVDEIATYAERGRDVVPFLLDRFGPYCAVCERPVLERAFAWDTTSETLTSPFRPGGGAPILLCSVCAEIQARRVDTPGSLALPFDTVLVLPSQTDGVRPEPVWSGPGIAYMGGDALIGMDDRSARTIDYFGLNGASDIRTVFRRRTGLFAADAVSRIDIESPNDRRRTVWASNLMATTGYLSVWLTAFATRPEAVPILRRLIADAVETVPSFFPGTDWARVRPAGLVTVLLHHRLQLPDGRRVVDH